MPKIDYILPRDDAFAGQIALCKTNLPGHATALGLSAAEVAAQAADADYFAAVLAAQEVTARTAQQWTGWKNLVRGGGELPPTGAPAAPALPALPAAVAPGVETRFRALARRLKDHLAYNEALGKALGMEGTETAAPDFATLAPEISVQVSGGRVEVKWGWGGNTAYLDMIELQVDRGDGKGWGLLAYDTTPGYVDTAPFPAAPARWTYRAIYRVGDAPVGQWSAPASVMVG